MHRPGQAGGEKGRPTPRVALATWAELPRLSEDDRELVAELERAGTEAVPAVWSDRAVPWASFDAVVIRSTWDYYRRIDEYLAWVRSADVAPRLWNPARVVQWNSHKSYLEELGRAGVPVVPTRRCAGLKEALAVVRREGWARAVLKPAVSAGGYRTFLLERGALDRTPAPWSVLAGSGELLVQPYLDEVERTGERSLVFFLGEYSHAFLRAPRLAPGSGPAEEAPVDPSDEERRVARRALASAPGPTLYARVDLVADGQGTPAVMELEVIEPALALRTSEGAAGRFARAVARVTGSAGVGSP